MMKSVRRDPLARSLISDFKLRHCPMPNQLCLGATQLVPPSALQPAPPDGKARALRSAGSGREASTFWRAMHRPWRTHKHVGVRPFDCEACEFRRPVFTRHVGKISRAEVIRRQIAHGQADQGWRMSKRQTEKERDRRED